VTNALIHKFERFARLSPDDRATLLRLGAQQIRHLAPHEDMFREGGRPLPLAVINAGWMCSYKLLEDGRRQIVGFFLPGDMSDPGVVMLDEIDHSVSAITPVSVSEISRSGLDDLLSRPRLSQALWWDWLVKMAIQREWALNLGQRDAFERLAHLFCELFLRLESVGLTSGDSCEWPLTQLDLAEASGLSAVHVNRTLQELRSAGFIVLRDHTLVIPNMAALQRVAMFNPGYLHLNHEGRHLDANES
jgi:CRP-like cAMP-binding protein